MEPSSRRTLAVAAVQLSSQADIEANLAACELQVASAAARGARLVVLPENFAYFGPDLGRRRAAESLSARGPILGFLERVAREHQITLIGGGFPEQSPDAYRPYNTLAVARPSGDVSLAYRKIHLFDVTLPDVTPQRGARFAESATTTAGTDVVVVPVEDGPSETQPAGIAVRVGMSICYDLRFPELYRALTRLGAEVVLVPAAFTERTGRDHWHVLLRARAIENQVFVVAANQWGEHPGHRHCYGHSLIVDPWGRVIAERNDGVGHALAELDFAELDRTRQALPCLDHAKLSH